jgi:hypothetical protein
MMVLLPAAMAKGLLLITKRNSPCEHECRPCLMRVSGRQRDGGL